jgi:hypothetical protein
MICLVLIFFLFVILYMIKTLNIMLKCYIYINY